MQNHAAGLHHATGFYIHPQQHGRVDLLGLRQKHRDIFSYFTRRQIDRTAVGIAVGRVGADHLQVTLTERTTDVEFAVRTRRQRRAGVGDVTAYRAVQTGVGDDAAQRPVTPEAERDAVLRVFEQHVRQQQRPGQGAAQRGGRGRRGVVAYARVFDECGSVGGDHADTASSGDAAEKVGHKVDLSGIRNLKPLLAT